MKRLSELESAAVESRQTNLFAFSPKMSYVPDEWVKADPDFWKPKSMGAGPVRLQRNPRQISRVR